MARKQKGKINPVAAVVTGAIVGAGVVATGMAMNSEKGRKKIREAKEMVRGKVADLKKKTAKATKIVKNSFGETVKNIKYEIKK